MKRVFTVLSPLLILTAIISFTTIVSAVSTTTDQTWTTYSPDGTIRVDITLSSAGELSYQIKKNSDVILEPSRLGIYTDAAQFLDGMTYVSTEETSWNNTYSIPFGKATEYIDCCNQRELVVSKDGETLKLYVRVYDDGVAYRYYLPGNGEVTIYDEYSSFNLPDGTGGWGYEWRNEYEGEYQYLDNDDLASGSYSMPLLASIDNNNYWALISEGNVYNAEGSYCASKLTGFSGQHMYIDFADSQEEAVISNYPFQTPQRFLIITDNLNDLVNSSLAYDVNPPSQIEDTSWIEPGRAAWSWWSEDYYDDIDTSYELQKKYVDFAASMNWEYVTVDAGWADWTDGTIEQLCTYAATKNVGIFIWANGTIYLKPEYATPDNRYYANNYIDQDTGQLVEHIKTWADWGIKGIKVDFMMDDSQEKMQTYEDIVQLCVQYHLMVNFHGSTKSGGECRTWPNVITSEAVRGAEHYLDWYPEPTAYHNCVLPFTRNVIGSMDYTPCSISLSNISTTQAHQLALSVVYESGIQHFSDSPDVYESWIGTEFLKSVPAAWDETKLISGFPGDYAVLARKNGNDWYIGGITVDSRTVTISLDFLESGQYTAYVYQDGVSKDYIEKCTYLVNAGSNLEISLLEEGGFAVLLSKETVPSMPDEPIMDYYEAEDESNTLDGGASVFECINCSGGNKVGNLGNLSGTLQFNKVYAETDGTYQMKIFYLTADCRDLYCSVNGADPALISIPVTSGSFDTVRSITVSVQLEKGYNTIAFSGQEWAPDIDRIGILEN